MTLLVTGAPGTVGTPLVAYLRKAGASVRVAARYPQGTEAALGGQGQDLQVVRFDFTEPSTWTSTFSGVDRMFLLRPPQLSRPTRQILPALDAAKAAGVRRVVFLSLQGAEQIRVVPHATIEAYLRSSGMAWTFVRAAYFMQNLATTHAQEIREDGEIWVPAGNGRTAFVDARDVAGVAGRALTETGHEHVAITPTGPEALTYTECAQILSGVLGRPIRYRRPGVLAYWRHVRGQGMPAAMAAVTLGIYSAARFGLAAALTDDVQRITGSPPIDFRTFAEDHAATWAAPAGATG